MFQILPEAAPQRSMPLEVDGFEYVVFGGPYRNKPGYMLGVKMAAEINLPCNVDCPTEDFQIPDLATFRDALRSTLMLVLADQEVYVGCMGGIGRTGLMLSGLAKIALTYQFGANDCNPVHYVREHFNPHAVETKPQQKMIDELDVTAYVDMLEAAHRVSRQPWVWTKPARVAVSPLSEFVAKQTVCSFAGFVDKIVKFITLQK